jgi:hypothetical protein
MFAKKAIDPSASTSAAPAVLKIASRVVRFTYMYPN